MTLPRIPTPDDLFHAARSEILLQHEALRRYLWMSLEIAETVVVGGGPGPSAQLPTQVTFLLGQLKSHLAFEESVLLPLLRAQGAAGEAEATAVVAEHERQRLEFARLIELSSTGKDLPALGLSLQLLVEALLVDMTFEERKLLRCKIAALPLRPPAERPGPGQP